MSYNKRAPEPLRLGQLRVTSGVTPEVVTRFYEALDCPRSLTAEILFRYGEVDQLLSLEADPMKFLNASSFRDAHLASSLLTRSDFLDSSFDREALALDKFYKFESRCKHINRYLDNSFFGDVNDISEDGSLFNTMVRKIDSVLGTFDPLEMFDKSSWGPGVSTLVKGEETFAAKKFQFETGITRDLYPLVKDLFPLAYPGWWDHLQNLGDFPHFEVGNAVVTVPKTSKIDRTIAIEPGLNLWFQLGIGRMISRRLGRIGIDLTDQSKNQRLAKASSKSGALATVDFSSASDSISTALVRKLFRNERSTRWFEMMDMTRSHYGMVENRVVKWEKFSSMGNGFTFGLETLIFYCAAFACVKACGGDTSEISVYGDDVIVPTGCYPLFRTFSEKLGFVVNPDKSYSSGPYRESCGSHYYDGICCKPVYLKSRLSSPQSVYNHANTLRIRAHSFYGCDKRFRSLFYYLKSSLPKELRFGVPAIVDSQSELHPLDGGFVSNFDEVTPRRPKRQIEGFVVKRCAWVPIKVEVAYVGLLLANLAFTAPDSKLARGNSCSLRSRTKCIVTSTLVRQWYDLGPWI